jgi:hypothetical protein
MDNQAMPAWPRLLDVESAAAYLSIGVQSLRDYVSDNLLIPVRLPGACLREKNGTIITRPSQRRMNKLLFDKADLDRFIEECKSREAR